MENESQFNFDKNNKENNNSISAGDKDYEVEFKTESKLEVGAGNLESENKQTVNNNNKCDPAEYKNEIQNKLDEIFNDKLLSLETCNKRQEDEILDLMFTFHRYTNGIENIKVIYKNIFNPPPKYNPTFRTSFQPRIRNKNQEEDPLNKSTFSTASRRSVSSVRSVSKAFGSGKERFEKGKLGAQKVEINIGLGGTSKPLQKSKRDAQSVDSVNEAKKLQRGLKDSKSAINHLNKNTNNVLNKKSTTLKNVKPILSSNISKTKNSNNTIENHRLVGSNNTSNSNLNKGKDSSKQVNPFEAKSKKSSNISNKTNTTIESNKNISSPIRPSFKFAPKKKNLSGSGSGIIHVEGVLTSDPGLNATYANMTNIFATPNSADTQNCHLTSINKNSFKSDNSNNLNNYLEQQHNQFSPLLHIRNNSENISESKNHPTIDKFNVTNTALQNSNKVTKFFNNQNYETIFFKIFEFLHQKTKFKNISRTVRDIYIHYEIDNIKKMIDYKSKEENPLFNIQITNEDIFTKSFIPLELSQKYSNEKGFKNLMIILFLILMSQGEKINNIESIINTPITNIVKDLESSINNDANIYSKYKEIIDRLKFDKEVYLSIKQLNSKDRFFEDILEFKYENEDLSKFDALIELIKNIKKLLDSSSLNLEIILDKEILIHKLDTLKGYQSTAMSNTVNI